MPASAVEPIDPTGAAQLIGALLHDAEGGRMRLRLRGILASIVVHAIALSFSGIDFSAWARPHTRPEEARRVQVLYIPARATAPAEPEKPKTKSKSNSPVAAPKRVRDLPPLPPVERRVDMNSIEISVALDTANQLPDVIRDQGGVLALVDRDDQSIARYIFEPPNWTMREAITDVSSKVHFSMSPSEQWALLRDLERRYGIEFDHYVVSALFNSDYSGCLQREIKKRADASHTEGNVKSALLVFTSSQPCGIDVLHVSSTTESQ
jgi:hypothetical protein